MTMDQNKVTCEVGIFRQLALNTYTTIVLGFGLKSQFTQEQVIKDLDEASFKLFKALPFLSGQVVLEGQTKTNARSAIRPKDCTEICPSYDELDKAKAPFSMLDANVICPVRGMGYEYGKDEEQPVLVIQANFVKGGLLLCFASAHNALDTNGQEILIRHFAAAARGDDFDSAYINAANQDPNAIVPLLHTDEVAADHRNLQRASKLNTDDNAARPDFGPDGAPWNYWRFSQDKLSELRSQASTESSGGASINDVITAFFMQRLTAARIKAGNVAVNEDVTCLRAVDARRRLDPHAPDGYLHHLVVQADTTWNAEPVSSRPLSGAAVDLRETLRSINDHHVRSLATLINNTEDKTTIFYDGGMQHGKGIMLSSWAGLRLANCNFGPVLGVPDFFRRPRLDPLPGLAYLMPRTLDGHIDLAVCLLQHEYTALENDLVWKSFTELIG